MFATSGNCVKLWNVEDYSKITETLLPSGAGDVSCLSFSNEGNCLAFSFERSREVFLRLVKNFMIEELPPVKVATAAPVDLTFANKAANYLAIAEDAGNVLVWDVKFKTCKKRYVVRDKKSSATSSVSSICFSTNDCHIAAGTKTGALQLLSVTHNSVSWLAQLFEDKSSVTSLESFSMQRGVIGATSSRGGVCTVDIHSGKVSGLAGHNAPCHALAFSPINDLLMLSGGYDKKLLCYDTKMQRTAQVVLCEAPITSLAFLPNGLAVFVGTMTGEVLVHDLRSLKIPVKSWSAHNSSVTAIKMQPAAKQVTGRLNSQVKRAASVRISHGDEIASKSSVKPSLELKSSRIDGSNSIVEIDSYSNSSKPHRLNAHDCLDSSALLSPVRGQCDEVLQSGSTTESGTPMTNEVMRAAAQQPDFENIFTEGDGLLSPVRVDSEAFYKEGSVAISGTTGDVVPCFSASLPRCSASPAVSTTTAESNTTVISFATPSRYRAIPATSYVAAYRNSTSPERLKSDERDLQCPDELLLPLRHTGLPPISGHLHVAAPLPQGASISELAENKENSLPLNMSSVNSPSLSTLPSMSRVLKEKNICERQAQMRTIEKDGSDEVKGSRVEIKDTSCSPVKPSRVKSADLDVEALAERVSAKLTSLIHCQQTGAAQDILRGENDSDVGCQKAGRERSAEPMTTETLTMSLVRSCVTDVMEEMQQNINRRFMHLHYSMITTLMQQTREIEELHKKYSLNEELLAENLRLQEELKYLRETY